MLTTNNTEACWHAHALIVQASPPVSEMILSFSIEPRSRHTVWVSQTNACSTESQ